MAKQKRTEPVSPAVAAQQSEWHCRQAAEFFSDSIRNRTTARARELSRKRFFENSRAALSAVGLDRFLALFIPWLKNTGAGNQIDEATALVRELFNEMQITAVGGKQPVPLANGDALQVALTNTQRLLSVGLQQVEAALRLTTVETGTIETRAN